MHYEEKKDERGVKDHGGCLAQGQPGNAQTKNETGPRVTAPRPKERGFHGFLCRQIAIPI